MISTRVRRTYEIRFGTKFEPFEPEIPALAGAVDMHAHGHVGQQDPLGVCHLASRSGMGGILWKTLHDFQAPWRSYADLTEKLTHWAETEGIPPVRCFFGAMTEPQCGGPTMERVRDAVEHGAAAIWLPVLMSVHSITRIGVGPSQFLGRDTFSPPVPEAEARALGGVSLLDNGRLRPEIRDVVHYVAERDVILSFGHASPAEAAALAEEAQRIGFRKCMIDHPLSEVRDLTVDDMRQLAAAGVWFNWTYDELSPMLGVEPQTMVDAIVAVGPEHSLISSDAGDPVLPHSVECMRLMFATLQSFGLPHETVEQMAVSNPHQLLQLSR